MTFEEIKMAIKKNAKKTPGSSTAGANSKNSGKNVSKIRYFLFCIIVLLILSAIGGGIYLICQIPGELLYGNRRFVLRRAEVRNPGYWQGRDKELLKKIGIRPGAANIFAIDMKNVRERTIQISNIKKAEVRMVLPDKMIFYLEERTPLAKIGKDKLVDAEGIVFNASESLANSVNLPEITGDEQNTAMLKSSLRFIEAVNGTFYRVKINTINIKDTHLDVSLSHQQATSLRVLLPADGDSKDLLRKLETTIIDCQNRNREFSGVDLRNPDSGILL